jgi:SAM-dependent MidA family methyltransferase
MRGGLIYEMRPLERMGPEGFSITGKRFSIECGESRARFKSLSSAEKDIVLDLEEGEMVTVSPNSIRLLEKLVHMLPKRGMLFIHDYGWVGNPPYWLRNEGVRAYGRGYKTTGATELEELVPKFQITVDVNFNELADYLKSFGEVSIATQSGFVRSKSMPNDMDACKAGNRYGFLNLAMRRD